jgi:hypothetical protein
LQALQRCSLESFRGRARGSTVGCLFSSPVIHNFRKYLRIFVSIAQFIERARPKRQFAGESPVGDTNSAGVVQQSRMRDGRAKAVPTARFRSTAPFANWGRSSPAERSFDMREAKRAALFVFTISEGVSRMKLRILTLDEVQSCSYRWIASTGSKPAILSNAEPVTSSQRASGWSL